MISDGIIHLLVYEIGRIVHDDDGDQPTKHLYLPVANWHHTIDVEETLCRIFINDEFFFGAHYYQSYVTKREQWQDVFEQMITKTKGKGSKQ